MFLKKKNLLKGFVLLNLLGLLAKVERASFIASSLVSNIIVERELSKVLVAGIIVAGTICSWCANISG